MPKHPRIDVVLTPAGKEALKEEPFYKFMAKKEGNLNCESVEDLGNFQRLQLNLPSDEGERAVSVEVFLPTHLILYTMSAVPEARKRLGFKDEQGNHGLR